ncbi:MAG: ABC transporter permease [Candidatus Thorarchaeota archaeon]
MASFDNVLRGISQIAASFHFASKNLWRHRRRSLNMLLAFLIGSALVSSFFIWENAALSTAIRDSLDDRDFEIGITPTANPESSHLLDRIKQWLRNETLVERTFVIYTAPGLFGTENLADSYQYFPRESNATPLLITSHESIKFVDKGFCDIISHQFRYSGSFSLEPGQVLLSKRLAQEIEPVIQRPVTVGSSLNFAYALRSEPLESTKTLGELDRTFIYNVTVGGIFQRIPKPNLSQLEFNPETLNEEILILPRSMLGTAREMILEQNILLPRLFIRLDRDYLATRIFDEIEDEIFSLKSRISHKFPQVIIKTYTSDIQETKKQFEDSRSVMVFLLIPIVLLAACFTYFAIEIVIRGRIKEMAVLRIRGAQTYQLFASFFLELMAITLLGLVVGVFLGRLVATIVPTATGFILFDLTDATKNQRKVPIPSIAWVSASIFCMAMILIPLLLQIRRFLSIDISEAMGRPELKSRSSRVGSLLMPERLRNFVPLVAALLSTFVTFIFLLETGLLARFYGASRWRGALFGITLIFWVAFTAVTARILSSILPFVRPLLRVFLGQPALIVARSLKRRHTQMLSLIIILTMTFSVGVFSLVNGSTLGDNSEKQLRYLVGSDFKIRTNPLEVPSELFLTQEPGLARILPIFYSYGSIGDYLVSIIGIDPLSYAEMAIWDSTSFLEPESDHKKALSNLAKNSNGIILNSYIAEAMGAGLGDSVPIFEINGELGINLRFEVVGIARSLPGFGSADEQLGEINAYGKNGGMVVIRSDAIEKLLSIVKTSLFLAKAQGDFDQKEIASRLRENPEVLQVFAAAEINDLKEDLRKISPLGIISVGFIVSAGVGLFSLTIFLAYLIQERKEEYAIMRSCGATQRQLIRLVLGEFAGVVSFSFMVGSVMGITFSWIYLKIAGSVVSENILPIKQVIPLMILLEALVIVTLFMLIATFFPARKISRSNVSMVLRSKYV